MAQAELTQQSVIEAGIAASLASDPDLLPEPSIWFQDFTFGGTMFDAAFGNAEALGGVGEAISDVAIDNRLEFERKEREENDPAKDAGMITELAASQRERLAAMQDVTVGGVTLTLEEWDEIAEALNDPAIVDAVGDELRAQGKTQAEINEIVYLTQMAASIAQKEARGLPLTAEEQAVKNRLDTDPDARAAVATGTETVQAVVARRQADMTPEQQATQVNTAIVNDSLFVQATRETVDRSAVADRALEVRSGESVTVRDGQSVASSVSPESMFDMTAYSPSEEFNLQGLDGIRVTEVEPVQLNPNQTQSEPVLGVRA